MSDLVVRSLSDIHRLEKETNRIVSLLEVNGSF